MGRGGSKTLFINSSNRSIKGFYVFAEEGTAKHGAEGRVQ